MKQPLSPRASNMTTRMLCSSCTRRRRMKISRCHRLWPTKASVKDWRLRFHLSIWWRAFHLQRRRMLISLLGCNERWIRTLISLHPRHHHTSHSLPYHRHMCANELVHPTGKRPNISLTSYPLFLVMLRLRQDHRHINRHLNMQSQSLYIWHHPNSIYPSRCQCRRRHQL